MRTTVRVVSLFSGCGGLDKGFLDANDRADSKVQYEIVWANDNFEPACKTYANMISNHIVHGDIRQIKAEDIPDADLILGGFPCQEFSQSWTKRGGASTERGSLYLEFCRIIDAKKPLAFLGENVKGILTVNKGKDWAQIQDDFASIGYNLTCKLYNLADYGVPQLRERVIIAGVRQDLGLEFDVVPPTHEGAHVGAKVALKGVEAVPYNNEHMNLMPKTIERLKAIPPGGNFESIPRDSHLFVQGRRSHVYRRLHPDKPSMTIIGRGGGGTWGYHWKEPRALTNRERARLQSFGDDFIFEGTTAEVREQIGNAVPPLFAKRLAVAFEELFVEEIQPKQHFKQVQAKNGVTHVTLDQVALPAVL